MFLKIKQNIEVEKQKIKKKKKKQLKFCEKVVRFVEREYHKIHVRYNCYC